MKNKNLLPLLILASAALWPAPARAAFDDVGVGARVTGFGNAFTAIADDVYAVYYNPAGLGTLDRPQAAMTYSRLHMGLSDNSNLQNSFLAYEHPIQYGRQGAWGFAWNNFSLSGLYSETMLYGSYGRQIFAEKAPNGLFAGASLKYMRRGVASLDQADRSFTNTGQVSSNPDPVLQKGSMSTYDLDLGFLYRVKPRWTAGLMFQHLLEPNIAIADNDTDKLGRNVKFAGAYRTPWTTMTGELGLLKAPDGATDKVFTVAGEKWLPTLLHGSFGLRGSLGLGSREYRQVTVGLSYKVYRMQVDYSFMIPLGTISGTFGSHRMGLSFLFGRPRGAEPKFAEAILENMRELAEVGTPEFRAQAEQLALYKRTAQQEFLRQARVDTGEGRFADAKEKLYQALGMNPKDRKIQGSLEALSLVAGVYPVIENFRTDAAQAALYEGVMDFIAGREKRALQKLAYAQSLNPADEKVERMLQVVERQAGLTRELPTATAAAPTVGKEKIVGATMALMEVALRESEYGRVMKLADEVLELDPTNVLAWKRKATALYAEKEHERALRALRSAYKYETRGDERDKLKGYIDALVRLIENKSKQRTIPAPRPVPSEGAAGTGAVSPVQVQRMYEAGVDLYAQGRLSEAANMFQQILRLDPKNKSAERALRRVQAEILQGNR